MQEQIYIRSFEKIDNYRGGCVIPCSALGELDTNTPTAVGIDFFNATNTWTVEIRVV